MENAINRNTEEFRELMQKIDDTMQKAETLEQNKISTLCGERYLTGYDIRAIFHISPRTLQEYRDRRIIPYTTIGGKILYPESELIELLSRNRVDAKK